MKRLEQHWSSVVAQLACSAGLFILLAMAVPAQAQTFQVIHSFAGQGDGGEPLAGLTMYETGKFYGTTAGIVAGSSLVFNLASAGSSWVLNPLDNFQQAHSGLEPSARVIVGPDGNLYGTTYTGGQGDCNEGGGCGVVFKLQRPASACRSIVCLWTETVLYQFGNPPDGQLPDSEVVFDSAGNLYGTTPYGGTGYCSGVGCGTVYKLTPSGQGWTETVIYNFQGGNDGDVPSSGLIFDAAGNLYGVTDGGGTGNAGTIYELSPSNGGWTKTILHNFQISEGAYPSGTLVADRSGNLYGSTEGTGTVFELSHPGHWTYQVVYQGLVEPPGPLAFDSEGNLYAANQIGGAYGDGSVVKLTSSGGPWTATDLHDFQFSDGVYPNGGLVIDSAGNVYGTAQQGGTQSELCYIGCGTVWEITP